MIGPTPWQPSPDSRRRARAARHVPRPRADPLSLAPGAALRLDGRAEEERAKLDREYHEALDCFEDEHGKLINAYWCADVESAVALTAGKPNSGWLRRLLSVAPRFHRVSDWATKDEPDIARALHHCDELAIRAGEVLRGRSRRIAVQLVMTSACHLLSLVDARGENPPQAHKAAVAAELRELAAVGRSYRQSANGDAQLVYFAGMAVGIAALGPAVPRRPAACSIARASTPRRSSAASSPARSAPSSA